MINCNPKYSLSNTEKLKFDILWKEEMQFFQEILQGNRKYTDDAKKFAERVYALALKEKQQKNK